jgi:hypothetical protein
MCRAQPYRRIGEGAIRIHKDGARTYITMSELERYVEASDEQDAKPGQPKTRGSRACDHSFDRRDQGHRDLSILGPYFRAERQELRKPLILWWAVQGLNL